ncbi:MAG: DUF4912 domain-containing protein, partial [Planctomycetota bacterium]
MRNTFLWLKQKTLDELLHLAKRLKISLPKHLTRNRLLTQINKTLSIQRKSTSRAKVPFVPPSQSPISPLRELLQKKTQEQLQSPFETLLPSRSREIFIDRGLPIPEQYFEDILELMPISPDRIYGYWELSSPNFLNLQDQYGRLTPLILKLQNLSTSSFEIFEINQEVTEFYFSAKAHQIYQLSLYLLTQQGQLNFLLESETVTTPAVTPSARLPEKWLMIEEDSAGKRNLEQGILVETEPHTALFVPISPAVRQKALNEHPVILHKKPISSAAEPPPFLQKEQTYRHSLRETMPQTWRDEEAPQIAHEPVLTPQLKPSEITSIPEKKFDLFSSLSRDPQGLFPKSLTEVLLYHQEGEGETEQFWIQETTGERWFWVPLQKQSFPSWVQGKPIHSVEGESGAWVQFLPGTGPILTPGKVSWYWGQRQGETWYFQEGETTFYKTGLPQPEIWKEIAPDIRWIDGGQEEGTLVFLDEPNQEFLLKVIEEPYLVVGSSEISQSSYSWITSFGLPRWKYSLSSWKFPVSSLQRIPTSGETPESTSTTPPWKRVSIPPSSWNYPIARPEVSSWVFPYRLSKPGRVQEWVPLSSQPGAPSS